MDRSVLSLRAVCVYNSLLRVLLTNSWHRPSRLLGIHFGRVQILSNCNISPSTVGGWDLEVVVMVRGSVGVRLGLTDFECENIAMGCGQENAATGGFDIAELLGGTEVAGCLVGE